MTEMASLAMGITLGVIEGFGPSLRYGTETIGIHFSGGFQPLIGNASHEMESYIPGFCFSDCQTYQRRKFELGFRSAAQGAVLVSVTPLGGRYVRAGFYGGFVASSEAEAGLALGVQGHAELSDTPWRIETLIGGNIYPRGASDFFPFLVGAGGHTFDLGISARLLWSL